MNEDLELVRQYVAHKSERAFEVLVSRYVNLVYSIALRRVCDPHLAEEITQVVFIVLARKAGALGTKVILPGWLHRTTCYAAADALKIQRRRQRREQEALMQSSLDEPQPPLDEVWGQVAPLLDNALACLSEKDRNAIVLRFFENKSMDEVGACLGATKEAAKMRVNRAVEKLRRFFARRGVSLSAAGIAGAVSANSVHAAPPGLVVPTSTLAHGTLLTFSTMSIVKGTLNTMFWAKLKPGLSLSVASLMVVGVTAILFGQSQGRSPSEGPLVNIKTRIAILSSESLASLGLRDPTNARPGISVFGQVDQAQRQSFLLQLDRLVGVELYDAPEVFAANSKEIEVNVFPVGDRRMADVTLQVTPQVFTNSSSLMLSVTAEWRTGTTVAAQPMRARTSVTLREGQSTRFLLRPFEGSKRLLVLMTPSHSGARRAGGSNPAEGMTAFYTRDTRTTVEDQVHGNEEIVRIHSH